MDKNLLIVFGILTFLCSSLVCSFNFESPIAKLMFLKLIKDKCYQNATQKEYEDFTNLTDNTMNCIKTKLTKSQIFKTPADEFKNNIQECSNEFIERMEDCLPEESKDWPQFNFDIVYSFIDFVYDNKQQLTSNAFMSFIESCVENFQQDTAKVEVIQCFSDYDPNVLGIKSLCRNMINMEKCVLTQVNERCPSNGEVEKLKIDFFAALREPCEDYSMTVDPLDDFLKTLSTQASSN